MIRCSRRGLTIFRLGNVEERIINEFNVAAMVQFQIRRAGGAKLAEQSVGRLPRPTIPRWDTNRLIALLELPGFARFATTREILSMPGKTAKVTITVH